MVSVGGRCLCIFPPSRLHKRLLLLCSDSCDCCYIKKKKTGDSFYLFSKKWENLPIHFWREWVNFLGEGLLPSTPLTLFLFFSFFLVSLSLCAPLLLWWWSSPGPLVMGDLSRLAYFLFFFLLHWQSSLSFLTRCAAVHLVPLPKWEL